MKTIKNKKVIFKTSELKKTVDLLLANNFKVYLKEYSHSLKDKTSYVIYTKEDNIAYLQSEYSGVKYSTMHKSKRGSNFGTGFGLCESPFINLTVKDLEEGFILAPKWARGDISKISKYKGLEDYLSEPINTMGELVEIIK